MRLSTPAPYEPYPQGTDKDQLLATWTARIENDCFSRPQIAPPADQEIFRLLFRRYCNTNQVWTEASLSSVFARKLFPPFPPLVAALPLLSKSYIYHSTFPFHSTEPLLPTVLDYNATLRAVMMMTGRAESQILAGDEAISSADRGGLQVIRRGRTESDRRRMLFQGFSTVAQVSSATNDDTGQSQLDEDDVLDTLTSLRAKEELHSRKLTREDIRPILSSLPIPRPHLLRRFISRSDLRVLLQLLLVFQLDRVETYIGDLTMQLPELERAAEAMFCAFESKEHEEGIRWPSFDKTIAQMMPRILDGIASLFETTMLTSGHPKYVINPILPIPGKLLTLPTFCQISSFLPSPALFLASETLFYGVKMLYSNAHSSLQLDEMSRAFHSWPGPSIFLVSGRTQSTAELSFFGAFMPTTWQNGQSLSTEESLLFRLRPRHTVSRAGSTTPSAWIKRGVGVGFGISCPQTAMEVSVSMGSPSAILWLDEELKRGVFTDGLGVLRPTDESSKAVDPGHGESVLFAIEHIEIWGVRNENS